MATSSSSSSPGTANDTLNRSRKRRPIRTSRSSRQRDSVRMKNGLISQVLAGLGVACLLCSLASAEVLKIVVNDTIQPITAEYIARAIDEAHRRNAHALLIELNTPGGLVDSTRDIIEKI